MVITLSGENGFALHQELRELVGTFLREHGEMALERIDGEEAEYVRIQEALTSLPFLSGKKMVVLRSPSANKKFTEEAETLLAGLPETTDVVLIEPKLDKRLSYYKYLKKSTDFRNFPELDLIGLSRWLVQAAKEQGGSISPADARYLVERAGMNQQLLNSELEKLIIRDPKITRLSIDELTEATPQSTIFQLLEAAFAGNAKKALGLYQEQRAMKVEPPQIIAMLAWQLHVLVIIKAAGAKDAQQIAKEAKLSPYVVQKSVSIARKMSLSELRKLIADLLKIDVRSKRESIDSDEALQHYLLKLAL